MNYNKTQFDNKIEACLLKAQFLGKTRRYRFYTETHALFNELSKSDERGSLPKLRGTFEFAKRRGLILPTIITSTLAGYVYWPFLILPSDAAQSLSNFLFTTFIVPVFVACEIPALELPVEKLCLRTNRNLAKATYYERQSNIENREDKKIKLEKKATFYRNKFSKNYDYINDKDRLEWAKGKINTVIAEYSKDCGVNITYEPSKPVRISHVPL